MRRVHFAGAFSFLAPGFNEFPVLGKLHDAAVGVRGMAVTDEDVAVRRDDHVGWAVEGIRTFRSNACFAESQ